MDLSHTYTFPVSPRPHPRRTCPSCTRRYAGLVDPECVVCHGVGSLTLGAAALHYYPAEAVGRAIELYLETRAAEANHTTTPEKRLGVVEAACDELRHAGVLATTPDHRAAPTATAPPIPTSLVELAARQYATRLGGTPTTTTTATVDAGPQPLTRARPHRTAMPTLSAAGYPSHLARVCDPVDPLGPDGVILENGRKATEHVADVITTSIPEAARRRRKRKARA